MDRFIRLLLLVFIGLNSLAISAQNQNLCQGHYYTEKEGADKLKKLLTTLHSKGDWEKHADRIRKNLRRGMELEVFPVKTPLNPRFRNKKILDGYSVESVAFESLPGFFVTGNLYKPIGNFKDKSLAVILSPHGHSSEPQINGRFNKDVQHSCATLAKMGAIVFAYDMMGYGESVQLPHNYAKVLTFQTWNSIRVIDFLLTLPEADPDRVAAADRVIQNVPDTSVFILDDGFQHWKIKKDLEIVALTSASRSELIFRDWNRALHLEGARASAEARGQRGATARGRGTLAGLAAVDRRTRA